MSGNSNIFEFFQFRKFLGVGQGTQIVFVSFLFLMMTLGYFLQVKQTGKMDGFAPSVSLLFVPIYEELIFRGVLLKFFEKSYGTINAVVFVSLLFGLWHVKNVFWLEGDALFSQIAYTTLFFSPITCWITIQTRSLWFAVMIHYLNNFPFDAWVDAIRQLGSGS